MYEWDWKWIEWIEFIRAYGWPKSSLHKLGEQAYEFLRAYRPGRLRAHLAEEWAGVLDATE